MINFWFLLFVFSLIIVATQFAEFPGASITVPVFTGTGLADGEAGTAPQYNFVSDLCVGGGRWLEATKDQPVTVKVSLLLRAPRR